MEKPIIVSQAKMMCDFVLDRKIGFAIDANNKQSYVDAVLSVFNKEKYAVEIPENCRKYHNIYNWEKTVQPLLKAYRNLI
jgi:glycosyltransferase involved in cell wall biosynthesis